MSTGGDWKTFGNGSIEEEEWSIIKDVLKKHRVKTVLEIGSGFSTVLFSGDGLTVHSYETKQEWVAKVNEEIDTSKVQLIHYTYPKLGMFKKSRGQYDFGLVDGPHGSLYKDGRRHSIAYAAKVCDVVALHDYHRKITRKHADIYFGNWELIGKSGKSFRIWKKP